MATGCSVSREAQCYRCLYSYTLHHCDANAVSTKAKTSFLKNICYFRSISRRQENTSWSTDLCELLWTVSSWLLSVHSKRYLKPNLHIITFPTRSITSWLTAELIDVCADWSSHSSFPQRHCNGYSGWKWLQPQKGPPTRACAAPGLGGFTLVQVATSYPSLCCVNRIISAEISPPLHWTAHHCPAAKIRRERIHILPHNLEETEDGWRDGGMDSEDLSPQSSRLASFEIEIHWTDWRW